MVIHKKANQPLQKRRLSPLHLTRDGNWRGPVCLLNRQAPQGSIGRYLARPAAADGLNIKLGGAFFKSRPFYKAHGAV